MASAQTSLTHWGAFTADVRGGDIASVRPDAGDADPSPLLGNLAGSIRHRSRIATPAVRRGWLDEDPGPSTRRGADEFVAVSWDELTELLSGELRRVVDTHGNEAIYGGSYGWASAGRLHHAQSQVHRFLKLLGGYTFSRHSYSLGATGVIMPRVVGTHDDLFQRSTAWHVIAENTELLVCFGGVGVKNSAVNAGGTTEHPTRGALQRLRDRGGRIVSFSPLRDDTHGDCEWLAPVPGTDVAIMAALAYVLATEGLVDRDFLETHCTGYPRFERYLLGLDDGVAKSPGWAAAICGVPADVLVSLARRMAAQRTIVMVSWSLQRVRYGEQAPWMGLTLAAMLGQIGLPGGGFGHGYGSQNEVGMAPLRCALPTFPQGSNPVSTFIPVAAVSDMLLHPGEQYTYNGRTLTYPDIKCVYWAGGNPCHHHQNLPRLRRALCRVDTVVVHDPYWTAMAKHADVVVPSTTPFEREDYSGSKNDPLLVAMPALAEPFADSLGTTTPRTRRSPTDSVSASVSPRAAMRGDGSSTCTRSGRRNSISRCRPSTISGRPADCGYRPKPDCHCSPTSVPIPSPIDWRPPAGGSRSSRVTSTGSATTTARVIHGGSSRTSGWVAHAPPTIRCTSWRISPPRGCTVSWTAAASAWTPRCKGANPSECIRTMRTSAG